jgi:hypothetical protein
MAASPRKRGKSSNHCAFDLPAERFSFIELTNEKGGERLDREPFAKGDIAVADRGFMHPDPLAHILGQGVDVIVRTGWKGLAQRNKPKSQRRHFLRQIQIGVSR